MSCWQTTWENMQPEDLRSPGWIECLRCGIEEQSDGATFDPDEDAWTCRGCLSVDEEHRRGAVWRVECQGCGEMLPTVKAVSLAAGHACPDCFYDFERANDEPDHPTLAECGLGVIAGRVA